MIILDNYKNPSEFRNDIKDFIIENNLMTPDDASEFINFLNRYNFFKLPASLKYHHKEEGGLYQHSFEVMEILVRIFEADDVFAFKVGLFHDICKIFEYDVDENGNFFKVLNNDIHSHGKLSVSILRKYFKLNPLETKCIEYHMGVYTDDKNYWNEYNKICGEYPLLILVHAADMMSANVK